MSPALLTPFVVLPIVEALSFGTELPSSGESAGRDIVLLQAFRTMLECWLNRLMRDELHGLEEAVDVSSVCPYPWIRTHGWMQAIQVVDKSFTHSEQS